MSRKIHSEKDSEAVTRDGTAARTRPLSIRDIMLRREKKAASEAKKTKEGPQENYKGPSDYMEHERGSRSRKEPKGMPVECSKKEMHRESREGSKKENVRYEPREDPKKDDVRYTPKEVSKKDNLNDRTKDGSKTNHFKVISKVLEKEDLRDALEKDPKKESSSIRDDGHKVVRDKGISTSHKVITKINGLADESKDSHSGDMRARNSEATKSRKLHGKNWNNETVADNRTKDRSEKLQNETKRKGRSFDDEKNSEVDRPVLKRHDSAWFQDSKHSDRSAGRKDYAKSYHGEPELKRRRSRSRDLDRERHGRSISPPLREQGHNRRGHDFSNYPMEKARRKHIESDKQRASGNGESYRRYESRLGGYSPRRKKTAPQAEQTTTKTPSLVTQSLEKKSATWDQPPLGADQSNFLSTLHTTIGQMAPIPANFFAFKKDPATKIETILAGNNLSADSVQLTQATRPLRRLHIENLPGSATEDMLIDCLNDFLLSSRLKHAQGSKPCLSCTINKEKRQAFVEFLTPEDATTALSFDGRSLNGSALKIRRPKEYVEMAHGADTKPSEEVTLVSDTVADSPHKIFVAGISGVISSEMLKEIVSAFGSLAAYRFLFNEELGGPCAFLEYTDPSITPKACAGLNGMKLGGRVLTAVHVFTPPAEVDNEATPFYGIPDNAKSLLEEPTKVLELKDVFDQEEYMLLSKSELEETLEDVRIECARFGAVKSVNVAEHLSGSDNTAEGKVLQPEDQSIKIDPTELHDHDKGTEVALECSVLNQSIDVPDDSDPAGKEDVVSIPKGLHQKGLPSNEALCEDHAPAADLDGIQESSALPSLQQMEDDRKVPEASTDKDKHMEAAEATAEVDDCAVEKGLVDSTGSETCTPGDEVEKSGTENKQLCADDAIEDHMVKVPTVKTRIPCVFEHGSILVEFTREEAACMAAHSLHGRRYGNRTVSVRYVPHDLYLQKYPK